MSAKNKEKEKERDTGASGRWLRRLSRKMGGEAQDRGDAPGQVDRLGSLRHDDMTAIIAAMMRGAMASTDTTRQTTAMTT